MPLDDDETAAQRMNRVSREIRAGAQPILGGGYSANIGGSMGPLSGTAFSSSNDRVAGQPSVAGVAAGLGPLSAQFIKPTQRGAPAAYGVGLGGKPFDADTYFGVNATKTPGGMQYGVNVGRDGAFLSGNYNPTRRDVNIMGGYERRFQEGGPVTPRRLGSMIVPPEEQGAVSPSWQGVGEGLQTVASGIGPALQSAGEYVSSVSPGQFVSDVGTVAGHMYEAAKENPAEFIGGAMPLIGNIYSAKDVSELKDKIRAAREAGREDIAQTLEKFAPLAAAGAVMPFGAGAATGAVVRGAERAAAKGAAKDIAKLTDDVAATDKAAVEGVVSSAEHAAAVEAPQVPQAVFQPEPVMTAFENTPTPEVMRESIIGEISQSIAASDGAVAKLPTTMGLGPMYVVDSGVQPESKGFILAGTTNKNASAQIEGISPLLEKYSDMALNPDQWATGMAEATGNANVVAPPYRFMKEILPGGDYEVILKNMTPGQVAERKQGIAAGKEFFDAFVNGQMKVEDTGKLFMWGMLSRGVNPYTHEGLFIDAFRGIEPWIKMAAEGKFTKEVAEGPYKEWAASSAQKGSGQPGAGAMHNLNAFGEDFLLKMGTTGADGITPLQKLHDLMCDPNLSGRDIRRAFAETGEGVGIDNKVVSFILLATGRDDVMVIDRIQLKNLWDDGRFEDFNIWDGISVPVVKTADGNTTRFPPTEEGRAQAKAFKEANPGSESSNAAVTGSSLAEATYGAKGILVYEAIEDALMKNVQALYDRIGMGDEIITPGIFHWDTWVARSNQEASHGSLPAILRQAQGVEDPLAGIYSKQGDYQTYAYGAKYFRGPEGPYFTMPLSTGDELRLSVQEMQRLQGELADYTKGAVPVPTPVVTNPVTGELREFANTPAGRKEANAYAAELTAAAREEARAANPSLSRSEITAIKVPVDERGFSVSSIEGRPWYEDQSINRERVDKLIRNAAQRSEQSAGSTAQAAVPNVAGRTVSEARSAAGFESGLPRTYGQVAGGSLQRVVANDPPAFSAPVVNAFEPNPSASSVYNQANHSTPLVYELETGSQASKDFHAAIAKAKKQNPFGAAVTLYKPKEYAGMRLFLTPDGTAGFALKGDDIVSVFNAANGPHRKVANSLLDVAISQGGRKLDAFDTALPKIYAASGFKTTSRMSFDPQYAPPGWNYKTFAEFNDGKPDVVHMVYDPRHNASYDPSDGRFFKDYDDAVEHQSKAVKTTNNYIDATRKAYDKRMKKATEATSFIPGFAKGGAVEKKTDFGDLIFDVAHLAARKDITKRQMALLVKLATGADAEWSANVAGHLIGGDGTKLRLHAERHPKIVKAVARINEMLGGNKWKGLTDEHPLAGARVNHELIEEAMNSGMIKDNAEMKKALRKLMEGSTHG